MGENKMKSAVLAAIGDELLSGMRQEANCSFLAWCLHDAGWTVLRVEVIPDEDPQISDLLERWVGKTDLLVLSGGLGPTHDDRTRDALARYLGCGLRSDPLYDRVLARYDGERLERLKRVRDTQSMIPSAAEAVYNPEGSALGIAFERGGTRVLSLPGVPMEYEAMVRQELPELFETSCGWASVSVIGLPETTVVDRIPEVIGDPSLHVSVLPSFSHVELIVRGTPERVMEAEALIRGRFTDVLPAGCRSLPDAVLSEARERGRTISCAESCTGGLIQGALTDIPGCSDVFMGGVVTYSNEAKMKLLGVPQELLERYGAVSRECALAMAEGVLRLHDTDIAVSVTGVAGPDGGTPEKPVGCVWIGLALRANGEVKSAASHRLLRGGRGEVRERAVKLALAGLWRTARDGALPPDDLEQRSK